MKHRSAMDSRLRLIEQLYDRDDGGGTADRLRAEHPEHREEIESIQSMKSALDARPRRRPAPATIDAVLQAAADASAGRAPVRSHPRGREDRRPRSRRAVYLRSAGAATGILTVLLFVTTVWKSDLIDTTMPQGEESAVTERRSEASGSTGAPPSAGGTASEAEGDAYALDDESEHVADATGILAERSEARGAGVRRSQAPSATDRSVDSPAEPEGFDVSPGSVRQGDHGRSTAHDAREQSSYAERLQAFAFPAEGRLDGPGGAELRPAGAGTRVVAPRNRNADRAFVDGLAAEFDMAAGSDAFWPNRANTMDGRRPSDVLPNGMRPMQMFTVTSASPSAEELAWDQGDMVIDMYQQIQLIEHGVARGWEPPSIPLEMVLTSKEAGDPSIRPAGEQRP